MGGWGGASRGRLKAGPQKVKILAVGVPGTIGAASLKSVCINQGRENWKVSGLWGGKLAGRK